MYSEHDAREQHREPGEPLSERSGERSESTPVQAETHSGPDAQLSVADSSEMDGDDVSAMDDEMES